MRLTIAGLVLLLAGCSSAPTATPTPTPPTEKAPTSWIAMNPGDAVTFDGPGGELLLVYVDETYSIGTINASALTWKLRGKYTTDYFDERDDGTLWWYGRRGEWRAGRRGAEPREVAFVDHRARFGDRVITVSEDKGPVQVKLPDGVYTR